jgi:hypothetical protein
MAAAADGKVNGMSVRGIGLPLARDPDGTLREGPIVIPLLSQEVRESIDEALHALHSGAEQRTAPMAAENKVRKNLKTSKRSLLQKAIALRDYFVRAAEQGDAEICTYAWAYRHLFGESPPIWSQAYARKVSVLAENTPRKELSSLGKVGLDSFIVSSRTGLPGESHWRCAAYDREEWERVLGTATLAR